MLKQAMQVHHSTGARPRHHATSHKQNKQQYVTLHRAACVNARCTIMDGCWATHITYVQLSALSFIKGCCWCEQTNPCFSVPRHTTMCSGVHTGPLLVAEPPSGTNTQGCKQTHPQTKHKTARHRPLRSLSHRVTCCLLLHWPEAMLTATESYMPQHGCRSTRECPPATPLLLTAPSALLLLLSPRPP